ncbi:MAG: hypothetical protein RJA70_4855, partial [Pseudomonadota bacterium]
MTLLPLRITPPLSPFVFVGGVWAALCCHAQTASAQTQLQPPPVLELGAGLQPPPPPQQTAPSQTEYQLNRAEHEDSGRGLQFVMLHADGAFQWVHLGAFSNDNFADGTLIEEQALGPAFGAGLALRLLYLTAGVRFRYGLLNNFELWSLGAEGALRIPMGSFEPFVFAGAGYSQAGSFKNAADIFALGSKTAALTANGFDARLGGGFDYYVTPVFSVGARADAELLYLN